MPRDRYSRSERSLAKRLDGRLELELGKPLVAIERFRVALNELEALPDQERDVALTHLQLARAQMTLKRYDSSLDSYSTAKGLFEELANAKPTFYIDLASTHAKIGVLLWRAGDRAEAALCFERALDQLDSVELESPEAAEKRSEEIRRVRDATETNLAKLRS